MYWYVLKVDEVLINMFTTLKQSLNTNISVYALVDMERFGYVKHI